MPHGVSGSEKKKSVVILSTALGRKVNLSALFHFLKPQEAFLMESYRSETRRRYGYLHFAPLQAYFVENGKLFHRRGAEAHAVSSDPVPALKSTLANYSRSKVPSLPPFVSGFVGYLAYDFVQYLEPVTLSKEGGGRDASFILYRHTLVCDSLKGTTTLYTKRLAEETGPAERRVKREHVELSKKIILFSSKAIKASVGAATALEKQKDFDQTAFCFGVQRLKKHIREGDIFQAVLSSERKVRSRLSPVDTYQKLRRTNPSPYHFIVREKERDLVGASPEPLVKIEKCQVKTFPIAGTRPRGATPRQDKAFARDLLRSVKERAEHVMLVDLSRNDLGKICRPGTVEVSKFMEVQFFSHVIHLVSEVVGVLEKKFNAMDALFAAFPAGTLTGAPKVRAMQIISEIEGNRRGLYGGVLVQWDLGGQLDSCLIIRSAEMKNGMARVRAGAGIVADSKAKSETAEILRKAQSVLAVLLEGSEA